MKYLSLMDANPGYHNVKLDENSSYLTLFHIHLAGINM